MTNYEKIKQKSIEEMAEILSLDSECQFCELCGKCTHNTDDCIPTFKLWLESEVVDETD